MDAQRESAAGTLSTNPRPRGHCQGAADLEVALGECRNAAREGFRIALDGLDAADIAIKQVSHTLQESMEQITSQGRVRISNVVEQLRTQLWQITVDLSECQKNSRVSLERRGRELNEFSIALFGRTMVGKSTLMEILTRGNGASIGKGGQRTTRDVRTYYWRGLKVTDVPGVAAFEGAEDEKLAFEAAEKADLILFLISDDAPQPVEAECLARVRALGKPVLGICNVKVSVEDEDDLCLFLRSQEKWFDKERLVPLLRQFHEFSDKYTPGHRVFFVWTHLLSRFLAIQPAYRERCFDLEYASRFRAVENQIVSEVIGRGKFLRIKSFIDGVVVPILDLSNQLLDFSEQNCTSGRVLVNKKRQTRDWTQIFKCGGYDRIDTFISKHIESIRDEIHSFSEENYDREDAGERWSKIMKNHRLEWKAKKFVEEIENECRNKLLEIARQIQAEIRFADDFTTSRRIKMDPIFDGKRAWKWATTIISGGLGIAAAILASGPLGWAAAAVYGLGWLFSLLFDDREDKARKQRNKLAKRLNENVDKIERNLRKKLHHWFEQELLQKQIKELLVDMSAVTAGLFALADRQRELAWALNWEQKKLHRKLLLEALKQLDRPDLIDLARDVARVPGLATMLVIDLETTFPMDAR